MVASEAEIETVCCSLLQSVAVCLVASETEIETEKETETETEIETEKETETETESLFGSI